MAKGVSRVIGRNGESMWYEDDELSFRTGGKVRHMGKDDIRSIDLVNAEEARKLAESDELIPHGAWTEDMTSPKGKSSYVAAVGDDTCWIMEVTKSQAPNALDFVRGIKPVEHAKAEDYKLYAAIQTPLGALFTIGSIVGVFLAVYLVYTAEMPILGLLCAIASIVMFINIK